ncbi:YfiT family bacillithiol transferase [Deinococcus peraridilitoris]|uniref:Putative metal-dependent hydrolase Deipe_3075 n=1 Tax=Deinococcus peraridilitoris (strain DSM 19664 / LMG 22246 / CIP 109416 / KR-200) TaxID=937777 RepID=L0A510_DEIPD|nr:bacillithiol transferase BstA [Deinococcus peraridilitoris]AFZ68524.1 Mycothiol maleylpyruvate isomerase N-terminal domain protein [Deinococcus peraridilitoris DSM 19664]
MTDERYPLGRFQPSLSYSPVQRSDLIGQLRELPAAFRAAVSGLSDEQLDTPYRTGGWTVRQLAHHLPDSHMNAYIRMKLALTETDPVIKPYDEVRWAELPDSRLPTEGSLRLLEALHERWVGLLSQLEEDAWSRHFVHPHQGEATTLAGALASYAWHGRHHLAHVTALRQSRGW